MVNLRKTQAPYYWNNIFLLLSMDMIDPYIHQLGFPMIESLNAIKPIARHFVKSFDTIYPEIHILGNEVNAVIINLFDETMSKIEVVIGQEQFQQFYKWFENTVILSGDLNYSLYILWTNVFEPLIKDKASQIKFFERSEARLSELKTIIVHYDNKIRVIKADEIENKSNWDQLAYSIYQHEGKGDLEDKIGTPMDLLWVMIWNMHVRAALSDIRHHLTNEEYDVFVEKIVSLRNDHPMWRNILSIDDILSATTF